MRAFLLWCALVALAACQKAPQAPSNEAAPAAEAGPVKGVDRSHKGQPFLDVMIGDPDGTETSYEGFRGIPTLMNFWATWCATCVKELPTLKKLADQRKTELWVVPVNQDSAPLSSVEAFLDKI